MDQIFYVNVLFGKNKMKIFNELSKVILSQSNYKFQVHPFRINNTFEYNSSSSKDIIHNSQIIKNQIKQHRLIMEDIKNSNINCSKPFENVIFVNYTTQELKSAIKFNRIQYYLTDFINEENIELLTLANLVYVNLMKKQVKNYSISLNQLFLNYSTLTYYDTSSDNRISNSRTLDIGEETKDDVTFILESNLKIIMNDENNENNTSDLSKTIENIKNNIILPYHPFQYSLFTSIQNIKENINTILMSKYFHLLYYPFEQSNLIVIFQNIMYERVLLNFLVTNQLYPDEKVYVRRSLFRNNVSYNYKYFKKIQKKYKTHILNELVFDYKDSFIKVESYKLKTTGNSWFHDKLRISNPIIHSPFATNIFCTLNTNGFFI